MVESFETSCGFHPIAEAENDLDQKAPDSQGLRRYMLSQRPHFLPLYGVLRQFQRLRNIIHWSKERPGYSSACSLTGTTRAVAANNAAAASSVGVDVIHENSFRSMAGNIDMAPSVAIVPACNESDMIGFVPGRAAAIERR